MESCRREIHVEDDKQTSEKCHRRNDRQFGKLPKNLLVGASWSMKVSAEGQWVAKFLFGIIVLLTVICVLLVPAVTNSTKQTMKWEECNLRIQLLTEEVEMLKLQTLHLQQLVENSYSEINSNQNDKTPNETDDDIENDSAQHVLPELINYRKDHDTQLYFNQRQQNNTQDTTMPHGSTSTSQTFARIKRASENRKPAPQSTPKYVNGKWLYTCPKQLVAKHYHGATAHYITRKGYLTAWNEDQWCLDSKAAKIQYDNKSGGLVVTVPGIYLFYAQVTFVKFNQAVEFQVLINSTIMHHQSEVGRCRLRSPATEAETNQPVSCSLTLLVCLNQQDKIYLKQSITNVLIDMGKQASFMGLARVARIKQCPTYSSV